MASSSSSSPEIPAAAPSTIQQEQVSYKYATHEEVLDELSSRFILNLPDEELSSLARICFQVEQAHWFYEDFVREQNPKFPSLPLKKFSEMLFHACPMLHEWSHDHEQAFNEFMQYKTRVPVCGAIMLNSTWEQCVLVKGWKSSSGWGFPKGKINEFEPEPDCAVREVLEETGYNIANQINPDNVLQMSIREQKISLYIVPDVPEDFPFKTKTRKEISKIEWFKLTDLPTWKRSKAPPGKFYLISPFIGALKAFIHDRKPTALPRKTPKGKTNTAFRDTHTQESSSQSSSADNGGPQTPSPQCPESTPHVANDRHVKIDNFVKPLDTESLDPHFARLLNSLTSSASANVDNPTLRKPTPPPLTISSLAPSRREPNTPVPPTAASSSNLNPLVDPVYQTDWSASAPRNLQSISVPTSTISMPHPSMRSAPPSSRPSITSSWLFPAPNSPSKHTITSPSHSLVTQSPTPSMGLSTGPSSTLSPVSSRGMSSRRSSSTADISPYLSRPVDLAISGRRLKQLALLETVADESAKMTPVLGNRELPFTGHPGIGGPVDFREGNRLPGSQPPTSSRLNDLDYPRVIYSSGPVIAHTEQSTPQQLRSLVEHEDPVKVRSSTSHNLERGFLYPNPSSTMRMNQSQLLALMNGASTPHPFNDGHYRNLYHQPPLNPSPHFALQQGSYPPPQRVDQFQPPGAFPQVPTMASSIAPLAPPPATWSATHPGLPSKNMQLLSILNGVRPNAPGF